MNKFMISRLYLKNFKSIDEAIIEFDGENLNVLDGPNGFGKTTIYDAIQLLLTGSIRRVESNKIVGGNKGFDDHLFSKDQTKPTEIIIEFTNKHNDTNLVLQRMLLAPNSMTKIQKRPQNFTQYALYRLRNFDDRTEKQQLHNSELDEMFGMKDMIEKFNLYQYIEQEESTYLFKKTDKDRMNLISKLFNIEEEVTQKDYLVRVKGKLQFQKNTLNKQLESIEGKLIKNNFDTSVNGSVVTNKSTEYKPIISSRKIINVPWDKPTILPLDSNLREVYLSDLDTINLMLQNENDFKNELNNEQIENVIKSEDKLQAITILGHFYEKFEDLKNRNDNQEKFRMILSRLKEKEFMKNSIDWSFVFQFISLPFDKDYIERNIELINSYSKNADHVSSLITKIIETRDRLETQFKAYKDITPQETIECPLCGDPKDNFEELTSEINLRTKLLKELLDVDSRKYEEMYSDFYNKHILSIIEQIEKWLDENKIDSKFFNQLLKYNNVIADMEKAKQWFVKENIQIEKFINYNEKYIEDVDDRVNTLKSEIVKRKVMVGEVCRDNITRFKRIFSDHLENDWSLLNQISYEAIRDKRQYIDLQYFLQTSATYRESEKLKVKLQKIDSKMAIIDSLLRIYNKKINSHRAKMLCDIEIPFYIYCGKIIQSHQRGMGVFIKEEKVQSSTGEMEINSLSFIPPVDTDHDIIHSFSSGQLSSTVIAFTLALNKVYGNSGIMTLLIDDPIQTMDEMNMASFVELLRNDFNDRQLVISTHEDNISLYLRYKFLKYGLSVGNINVKQNLYSK